MVKDSGREKYRILSAGGKLSICGVSKKRCEIECVGIAGLTVEQSVILRLMFTTANSSVKCISHFNLIFHHSWNEAPFAFAD